jgi:Zn-dependent peptidase ImmA (M78 family)
MNEGNSPPTNINTIRVLRQVMPARALNLGEAYTIAEMQASKLLSLLNVRRVPVDLNKLSELPRIRVTSQPRHAMPTLAGFTEWRDGQYTVVINRSNSLARRRFTFGHEFKHILDWTLKKTAYARLGSGNEKRRDMQIEHIADHFSACLLMPRAWLKRHWCQGYQDAEALAQLYGVSLEAMTIRLRYLGLLEDPTQKLFRRETPRLCTVLTEYCLTGL